MSPQLRLMHSMGLYYITLLRDTAHLLVEALRPQSMCLSDFECSDNNLGQSCKTKEDLASTSCRWFSAGCFRITVTLVNCDLQNRIFSRTSLLKRKSGVKFVEHVSFRLTNMLFHKNCFTPEYCISQLIKQIPAPGASGQRSVFPL